jgi:hypothetical protein
MSEISTATRSTSIVILAALVAMGLKIYCAAMTIGTNDVPLNFKYGKVISEQGLDYLYRSKLFFNHTPAVGSFLCLSYNLAAALNPPGTPDACKFFPLILRFPGIVADFLVVMLLLKLREKTGNPPTWALVLFALSPVSFMVSGYHGNVDPVMVLLLVVAAFFCVNEQAAACGLFLGLACNVKIIPLVLTPIFFFFWLHRGKKSAAQFALASALTCLAGWSAALIGSPGIFLKNVLGYNSYWGYWGVTHWLSETKLAQFSAPGIFFLTPAQRGAVAVLKLLIILGVVAVGWRRRSEPGEKFFGTVAIVWVIFFVLAPGIGPQYLVWLAPFVLLYSPPWYLAVTAASSLFLFVQYNTISHGMPWFYGDSLGSLARFWLPYGDLLWAVFVVMLAVIFKKGILTPAFCNLPWKNISPATHRGR